MSVQEFNQMNRNGLNRFRIVYTFILCGIFLFNLYNQFLAGLIDLIENPLREYDIKFYFLCIQMENCGEQIFKDFLSPLFMYVIPPILAIYTLNFLIFNQLKFWIGNNNQSTFSTFNSKKSNSFSNNHISETVDVQEEKNNNDKKEAFRKYTYDNGDVYEGGWKDGAEQGYGKHTWVSGSVYEGEWKDGEMTKGKYTSADGDVYEGEWKDGTRNGYGKMTLVNGDVYEGEWKDGEMVD